MLALWNAMDGLLWHVPAWIALTAILLLPPVRRVRRLLRRPLVRFARRADLSILAVGLLSGLIAVGLSLYAQFPLPQVHDEFSHLLAADTFAQGRLNNPPHPLWEFFESFHVLQQPKYMSKYPPGQGLALALGQVLTGLPIVGAWISTAAACAAVAWALYGWAPARWALIGGLLTALHPVVVDWSYTYWGGSVALLGGALVGGALPRLLRAPTWRHGLWFGIGLAILAMTRPFEGAIFGLLCGVPLLAALPRIAGRWNWKPAAAALAPAALVLLPAIAWLGYYNYRATGSPTTMPYELYEKQYAIVMPFEWQPLRPEPQYRHEKLREFNRMVLGWLDSPVRDSFLTVLLDKYWNELVRPLFVPPLSAVLLLTVPWALWTARRARLGLAIGVAFALLAVPPVVWTRPQYVAPAGALFALAMIVGLRLLRTIRLRGVRVGRPAALALVLLMLAVGGRFVLGHYHDVGFWTWRDNIESDLRSRPGRDLVIVRYGPRHSPQQEWVYNRADIDGAEIIWARDMGPQKNTALREYFRDRRVWLLEADGPSAQLTPYPHGP